MSRKIEDLQLGARAANELHPCARPRWLLRVRSANGNNVRCRECGRYWPRWVAFEQQKASKATTEPIEAPGPQEPPETADE